VFISSVLSYISIIEYLRGYQKWATYGTQDEEKQNKNTPQYVVDTTKRKHK